MSATSPRSLPDSRRSSSSTLCSLSADGIEQWKHSPQSISTLRITFSGAEDSNAIAPQLALHDSHSFVREFSPRSTVSLVSASSSARRMATFKSDIVTQKSSMLRLLKVNSLFSTNESDGAVQHPPDVGTFHDSDSSEDNDEKRSRQQCKASKYFSEKDVDLLQLKVMDQLGIELERPPESQCERWFLHARIYIALKKARVKMEPPYFPTARIIAASFRFEILIAVIIIINAAVIGWGTMSADRKQQHWAIDASEQIFTFIFLMEFVLRIMAYSWVWMFEPMNMFDTLIVWVVGVLVNWILVPLGCDVEIIHVIKILRILRVARLIRVVRVHPYFRELWMLVSGVVGCLQFLFWAVIIMGAVHFMFAVASIEMLAKNMQFEDDALVQSYLGSILPAMFTLFQLMTLSSSGDLMRPTLFKAPEMSILFFLWIGMAGIVLRNLVTAIVVKNALLALESDKEAQSVLKQSQDIKTEMELQEMFEDLDEDRSGFLTRDEFADVLGEPCFLRKMKTLDIDLDELPDIFAVIDDGDGCVTIEEFCNGLSRMQGPALSRDALRATHTMKKLREGSAKVEKSLVDFAGRGLDAIEEALDRSHEHFLKMHMLTADVLQNLNSLGVQKVVQASTIDLPALKEPTSNEDARRPFQEQPFAGATSMAASALARLDSIPPMWVADRRGEACMWQKTESNPTQKKETLQEGPHESKEPKKLMMRAGEWDDLQANHNLLQSTRRCAKSSNDFAYAKAIVVPRALVQRVTTESSCPATALREGTTVQTPKAAPEHKSLSWM